MADLHYRRQGTDPLASIYHEISAGADFLVLGGDITDNGLPEEAETALADLRAATIPVIAVLGNHDYQSGREHEVRRVLEAGGVKVLDGESVEIGGVGFAGVKGFGGGFGTRLLEPWGEHAMKAFVQEALNETLKLESAMAKMRAVHRIVILHYSPIAATVEGEPREIYPFLGSSRLEDPINRHGCAAVFHGHAHRGAHEGKTQTGIPVFNVSLNLLKRSVPGTAGYKLFQCVSDTSDGREASETARIIQAADS